MIQRIQSVYLFFIAVLMTTLFFYLPGITLPVLVMTIAVLSLINIFLYKKRKLQIKICCWILVLILLAGGFIYDSYDKIAFPKILTIAFPLIALAMDCMSIWKIRKDEKLVNSLNRIR